MDTATQFAISDEQSLPQDNIETYITALSESWNLTAPRQSMPDSEWVAELTSYVDGLVDLRVDHVRSWLDYNLGRFEGDHAAIEDLRRRLDNMVIELRSNVQLCGTQCASCSLLCIRSRFHEGEHGCSTDHKCVHTCGFCRDNPGQCGIPYDILSLSFFFTEEDTAPGTPGSTRTSNWWLSNGYLFLTPMQLHCHHSPVRQTLQTIRKARLFGEVYKSLWRQPRTQLTGA
jgi:hypothetical protein